MIYRIRNIVAALTGLVIRHTDFRFSKDYRWGVSRFHRAVYACCNTVAANYVANGDSFGSAVRWGL